MSSLIASNSGIACPHSGCIGSNNSVRVPNLYQPRFGLHSQRRFDPSYLLNAMHGLPSGACFAPTMLGYCSINGCGRRIRTGLRGYEPTCDPFHFPASNLVADTGLEPV